MHPKMFQKKETRHTAADIVRTLSLKQGTGIDMKNYIQERKHIPAPIVAKNSPRLIPETFMRGSTPRRDHILAVFQIVANALSALVLSPSMSVHTQERNLSNAHTVICILVSLLMSNLMNLLTQGTGHHAITSENITVHSVIRNIRLKNI